MSHADIPPVKDSLLSPFSNTWCRTEVVGGPANNRRREMVTFDGSSTAAVEITEDGGTACCSLAAARATRLLVIIEGLGGRERWEDSEHRVHRGHFQVAR